MILVYLNRACSIYTTSVSVIAWRRIHIIPIEEVSKVSCEEIEGLTQLIQMDFG